MKVPNFVDDVKIVVQKTFEGEKSCTYKMGHCGILNLRHHAQFDKRLCSTYL